MKFLILLLFSLPLFVLNGCGDDAQVRIVDRNITHTPPECLRLDLFPPDAAIRKTMMDLYPFSPECPYVLSISYKNGIHCNSNANAPRKTLSNFPSAYLRLELRKGMKLLYSYYRDLTHPVKTDDLEDAFRRFRKDVSLPVSPTP